MEETMMRRRQVSSSGNNNNNNNIPAFGDWDDCDDLPITQYFESAAQAGLLRGRSFQEPPAAAGHAFNLSAEPVCPTYRQHRRRCRPNDDHPRKQVRRSGVVEREYVQCGVKEQQQRKQQLQGRVVVAQNIVVAAGPSPRKPPRAPKAVDEDLYKIPPEFLYEKPRRKKLLRNLWSGCLGLNCVA
ncbi:uncharacterized protein LOC109722853 isoform X1 [Ananas comosus]|uniref:Uncharacterized protein LOC109722853 isoform X1 n=1 Tax=Ananas comosus TaxID=4615 RepID=A0A6P5GMN6_ANACO|nr:uncharacterized protein LOC109722853 isoform X1 [Ananas comosus]